MSYLEILGWALCQCQVAFFFSVAVSCGYDTCFAVKTCDGLYYFIFSIDRVGIPFGFQPIIWTFVRHTVSMCLIPVPTYGSTWVVLWLLFFRSAPSTFPNKRSTHWGRESLVVRLHSEIDQIHLSIEAQCVTTLLPLGACHIRHPPPDTYCKTLNFCKHLLFAQICEWII